ncbi:hypothetical protein ACFSHQ_11400 [Gemmobacter lanyuensis]
MRITNCHTHLFTHRHVPRFYPHPLIWPFKRAPGLVRGWRRWRGCWGMRGGPIFAASAPLSM